MKVRLKYILSFCLIGFLSSCSRDDVYEKPIVSVGDKVLTASYLRAAIPASVSVQDSALMADEYIRNWVSQQVLLQKAEIYLADSDFDIEAEVAAFRNSLIVEKYQQKLVSQKFDPEISEQAISDYYESMKSNFLLSEPIIKCFYAVLPKKVHGLKDFLKLINPYEEDDFATVEQYLLKYGLKYDNSVDQWKSLSSVRVFFPNSEIKNEAQVLKSKKLYSIEDEGKIYLLLVFESRDVDDYAPIEFVHDKIYSILLNKAKIEFMKKFKNELYEGALKSNLIKYY